MGAFERVKNNRWQRLALGFGIVGGVVLLLRPMRIEGDSMLPTYHNGDIVLTLPFGGLPKQGDVVVFRPPVTEPAAESNLPLDPNRVLIKRVVGLPGQAPTTSHTAESALPGTGTAGSPAVSPATHVQNWGLATEPNTGLGPDQYFLIGDNPTSSIDSRQFGSVPRSHIERRVLIRIWSAGP